MNNKVIEGLKCCTVINSCPTCPYNDSVTAMKIAEALQEFARRLKKKKSRDILGIELVRPYVIDKVLKEMEET